jgi:hypothetical protein
MHLFNRPAIDIWAIFHFHIEGDMKLPDGVEIHDNCNDIKCFGGENWGHRFKKDGELLTSDNSDFTNILFNKDNLSLENVKVFSILTIREYISNQQDHLSKHIRTFETSSLFDARNITIMILGDESIDNPENTYITCMRSSEEIDIDVNVNGSSSTPIEPSGGGEPVPTTGTVSASGTGSGTVESQSVYQVITFQMKFINTGSPENMSNQAFADYLRMGFTFKFTNCNDESFYLTPEVSLVNPESTSTDITKINLKVIFTQEMGVLADDIWNCGANLTIFATTQEGFIYRIVSNYNERTETFTPLKLTQPTQPNYNKSERKITSESNKDRTTVNIQ